jgi:2'-5' RNA ligase superfamily
MAEQIAAHVTLVYPREVTRLDALLERTRLVLPTLPPFRLRLGRLAHFGQPEDGVYVEVEDVEGGYRAARAELLGPPFRPTAVVPHVTIVHPPDISARPRMLAGAGGHRRGPRICRGRGGDHRLRRYPLGHAGDLSVEGIVAERAACRA